jgi:hypothetical protein
MTYIPNMASKAHNMTNVIYTDNMTSILQMTPIIYMTSMISIVQITNMPYATSTTYN